MKKLLELTIICLVLVWLLAAGSAPAQSWKELLDQADSLSDAANYDSAIIVGQTALEKAEAEFGAEDTVVALIFHRMGVYHYYQANYEVAESLWNRALSIREKALGPDHPDVASSMNNLAILYHDRGEYAEAEPLYKRALDIYSKALGSEHPNVAKTLSNLGLLYHELGNYVEAELLQTRALVIREKTLGSDHYLVAYCLNNLAILFRDQRRYAQAELLHKRALLIFENTLGPDHPDVASSLNNIAILCEDQGKYGEAELLYKRALAIRQKTLTSDHPDLAYSLYNLGDYYRNRGKYVEAEQLYKRALFIWEKANLNHPLVAEGLESFSKLHRSLRDTKRGLETATKAFEIRLKNFRDCSSVMSEKDALTYSEFMRNSASNYLSLFLGSGVDEDTLIKEAADAIICSKGQVSDEIFARHKSLITETDLATQTLARNYRYTKFRIAKLFVEGPPEDNPETYRPLLDSLTTEKERLESELARESASFRRQQELSQVDTDRILSSLPKKSVLVEYLQYNYQQLDPDSLVPHYLILIASSSNNLILLDLGEAKGIDSLVDKYRRHLLSVSVAGRSPSVIDQLDYEKVSKALYEKIWKPIEKQTSKKDLVFIAPDGGLNMISFAGLIDEDGKYLIEKYPIHYLSSGRDLIRLKEEAIPGSGLFALGDPDYNATAIARLSIPEGTPQDSLPQLDYYTTRNVRSGCVALKDMTVSRLPWTRSEVEKIAEDFRRSSTELVTTYFGADASEEHFKYESPGNRVIHLATHGYFIQGRCQVEVSRKGFGMEESYVGENPLLLSGLFLAGANLHGEGADSLGAEDGILTAEEVTAMNLDGTELVVLSACETGLGEVKSGEGVYGLRRAFQMAGARTVISALWPVSDKATADMMSQLYASSRKSLPEIMREIQLEKIRALRKNKQADHPFSWGAFIVLGDWR